MINRRSFITGSALAMASLATSDVVAAKTATGSHWRKLADLPYPVQEIYPALVGDNIHVAGGFAVQQGKMAGTARHIQYSIPDNRWHELAPLPQVRHHTQLVNCNGSLYALGGFKPETAGDWVMQSQSWLYDSSKDIWSEELPAPEVHAESVCLPLKNNIHLIGGRTPKGSPNAAWQDHGDSTRHLLFDTSTTQWLQAAPALNPRISAAGAVIDGQLYVVGGRTVSGGNVNYLEIYDAKEDKWRLGSPLPQAQGGLAAATIDNQLFAFGGEFFSAKGFGVHAEAWRYEPAKDSWSAVSPMVTPRHGLGAVSDGTVIYVMGGATRPGTMGTSQTLEVFYPK